MTINIAYSCDQAYIHHTGISILSLLETNRDIPDISLFLIQKDVKQESILLIQNLARQYNRRVRIVPFDEICFDLNTSSFGRHVETIYAKLFFERIGDIDKILYIDSDTIIAGSLQELWDTDLGDNLFAGVNVKALCSVAMLGLERADPTINDGVVIVNVKELRRQRMLEKFKAHIEKYNGSPPLLSEGTINSVCAGKIKVIHPKYNLMSGLIEFRGNKFADVDSFYSDDEIRDAIRAPVVIHFLSAFYNRPWDLHCTHPMRNHYLYYKAHSVWKDVPLGNKKLNIRLRLIKILYDVFPHNLLDFIRAVQERYKK